MKNKDGRTSGSSSPATNDQSEPVDIEGCNFGLTPMELPYLWYPNQQSVNQLEYVRRLECEFTCLQRAFLTLTTQFARLQFRVRQIVQADPCERDALLLDLERLAFNTEEENDELPPIQRDAINMGDVRRKQSFILERLRSQLSTLSEAQSWQPIPELDAAPPEPGSIDEVTCFCIKKKRKPPPPPETPTDPSTAFSSAESTHSTSSKSKTETGVESESEGDKTVNANMKQRVSITDEEALAYARNGRISVTTSKVDFEFCEEACSTRKPRPCDCKPMKKRNEC